LEEFLILVLYSCWKFEEDVCCLLIIYFPGMCVGSTRFWIFAPRSTTHDIGGWYIETWEKEDHVPRSKTLGLREHNEQRLHPAMFIMAVAYKTLDSETGRTYEKSLVSKIAKVKDTLSTFLKWWKTS
jgi:hypothetical protein